MAVPTEIRAVPRPKNTVVIAYGKDKNLYAVRQRVGCRNVDGRHLPVNGPTIGHIIDGVYVPIDNNAVPGTVASSPVDLKDWANIILSDRVFQDILKELSAVYNPSDAMKIYCIAILRVCEHGLSKIVHFMRNRTSAVSMDHHLLVDGTLKSDESKVNSLSDFSRKARTKGTRDISVLYAFDLEEMEPVCSKCFPGNMLDATSYGSFISENRITKGIIVGDKGFPESAAHEHFEANPDLHYLNPVKRNSKLISRHNMLDFTGILSGYEGITYRKEKCTGTEKWLYSYRDSYKASKEERDWLRRAKKNKTYSLDTLREKQKTFGTIVLESDLDLPSEIAYKAYEKRWEIEIVMRYYKSACEFDETRVQDDYSVIGSEFCDFLSTLLTFRLIKAFDQAKLLEERTYKKIMSVLSRAKKVRTEGDEWQLIRMNPSHVEMLQELEIIPKPEDPPKKRPGRPKGSKNKPKATPPESIPATEKPKRGRPKGSKNRPKITDNSVGAGS